VSCLVHRLVLDGGSGLRLGAAVARTGVAVAHRRLGPSSSATTSTVDRALPSSAVQLRNPLAAKVVNERLGHANIAIT
jgi:hypothetical protein